MGYRMQNGNTALLHRGASLQNAFTLIEMLVVMTIVALLLTLALPRYFASLDRSKVTVLQENLRVMRVSLDKFYADKGHYPEDLNELVERKYLRSIPVDPFTDSSQTWIAVPSADADQHGVADVKSGAQGSGSDGKAYGAM